MLTMPEPLLLCKDAAVNAPAASDPEALCSPSGWKRRVELWENIVDRRLVVHGEVTALLDEELEAAAVSRQRKKKPTQ